MGIAEIIQLLGVLLPIAEKAGVDVYNIIEGLKAGKTIDELIAEAIAAKTDLPDLPFAGE